MFNSVNEWIGFTESASSVDIAKATIKISPLSLRLTTTEINSINTVVCEV